MLRVYNAGGQLVRRLHRVPACRLCCVSTLYVYAVCKSQQWIMVWLAAVTIGQLAMVWLAAVEIVQLAATMAVRCYGPSDCSVHLSAMHSLVKLWEFV